MLIVIGFVLSLAVILALSKKNLWASIILGAIILSIFSQDLSILSIATISTLSADNLLLAFALIEIPIIGKILEEDLVSIFGGYGKKGSAIFGPATLGLLPIPGGAILSCPIIEPLKDNKSPPELVAINIWFRHFIFFIYPLSSILIIAVAISGIDLITAIILLGPIFIVSAVIGYLIYVRDIPNESISNDKHSKKAVGIIVVAPILQLVAKSLGARIGLATFIAVSVALLLAINYTRSWRLLTDVAKKVKAWNFGLILLSIILYAEVFKLTPTTQILKQSSVPIFILTTIIPFLVGFATGRVQLSIAIIIPIIIQLTGSITPGQFVMVYTLATTGYLMSPAHPCLVLSVQYFHTSMIRSIEKLLPPITLLSLFAVIWGLILG